MRQCKGVLDQWHQTQMVCHQTQMSLANDLLDIWYINELDLKGFTLFWDLRTDIFQIINSKE